MSGTTSSGLGGVQVGIYGEGTPYRSVTVAAGVWSADFSVPWEDQGTWDIEPGTQGEAYENDADGDGTNRSWSIPNPQLTVFIDELIVHGYQWADGVSVDLMVQRPAAGGGWEAAFHTDTTDVRDCSVGSVADVCRIHDSRHGGYG